MTRVESTLKRFSCAPSFLSLLLIGCAASGCGQPADPVIQPIPEASFEWPNAGKKPATIESPSDESLTSEDYLRLGMPSDDRNWSSIDMVQAQKILASLPGGHASLPRYQSERSGAMFARLTSSQNLELFRNRSLPPEGRISLALNFGRASNEIFKLYLAAFIKKKVRDSEMIELLGAQLRMVVVNADLMNELAPTLDKGDPAYSARMQGFEQAKRGAASVVMGALQTFDEQQTYRQSGLERLADYVRDTFPTLVPFLPPGARAEAKATLKTMLEDPKMEPFHIALRGLSEQLENAAAGKAEVRP